MIEATKICLPINSLLVKIEKNVESDYSSTFSFDEEERFITYGYVENTSELYDNQNHSIFIPVGAKVAFAKTKYMEIPDSEFAVVEFKDVKWWII